MRKFTIIRTPRSPLRRLGAYEVTSGSLSLFDHVRLPVAGDYLYLGEDMGPAFEVDWVLFEIDSGDVVIAVTQLPLKEEDAIEKERETQEGSASEGSHEISTG